RLASPANGEMGHPTKAGQGPACVGLGRRMQGRASRSIDSARACHRTAVRWGVPAATHPMTRDADERPHAPKHGPADALSQERFWNTTVLPLLEQLAERQLRGERDDITLEAGDLV